MKDIMECTDDYLMLELPINRAVRVDLIHQPEETITHEDEDYSFNEYVTKVSPGYHKLLNFITNTESIIHGNCPKCERATYYKVGRGCELDEKMLSLVLRSYVDEQIDSDDTYIPEPDIEMRRRAEELVRRVKFFDKKFQCPKCKKIYQASFALEYHEEQKENTYEYDYEIVLIKIGQYPSLQEFAIIDRKGFDKVLDILKIKNDYRNAIRNHINGDNIAAYVYLRRIVENIIMDSYKSNKNKLNISDDEFEKLRTREKINKLKDFLPKFLFDNKEIYPIVSAGIHTLTEEQCEKYYDNLKDAIDIILHQEAARIEELSLMKKTTKGIQGAIGEIEI